MCHEKIRISTFLTRHYDRGPHIRRHMDFLTRIHIYMLCVTIRSNAIGAFY